MVDATDPDTLRKQANEAKACEIAGADRVEVFYPSEKRTSVLATFYFGHDSVECSFPTKHVGADGALLMAAEDARKEAGRDAKPLPKDAVHSDAPDPDEQPAKKTIVAAAPGRVFRKPPKGD